MMDKYQTFSANDFVKNAYHLQLRLVDNWYNIYILFIPKWISNSISAKARLTRRNMG
jgi:hypothetical protein